jgi:hypothetical protein
MTYIVKVTGKTKYKKRNLRQQKMKSNRKDQKDGSYKEWSKMETMLRDPSPRGRKLRFMKMVAEEGQWMADRERKQQGREMKTGFEGLSLSLSLLLVF